MEGGDLGRKGRWSQKAADNLPSHALVSSIVWGPWNHPTHMTTNMFVWAGSSALPHHINAMGREATSLLELPVDATHARAPARESRRLQDKNGCRMLFINTVWLVTISNRQTFCDKSYRSTSVWLVKILKDRSIYRVQKHFSSYASVLWRLRSTQIWIQLHPPPQIEESELSNLRK